LRFSCCRTFYETAWFRYVCILLAAAGIWGLFRLRVRQIGQRFALVLDERARLAREIHDTLAQGFVGISSQLDAVALTLNGKLDVHASTWNSPARWRVTASPKRGAP